MPKTDWRAIADQLASRLRWHAACEAGHKPYDPECPFCADLEAFDAYKAAGGTLRMWEPEGGTTVTLEELRGDKP